MEASHVHDEIQKGLINQFMVLSTFSTSTSDIVADISGTSGIAHQSSAGASRHRVWPNTQETSSL
jgi:hypothetical protein